MVMKALDRKLFRVLWTIKGQVIAIAMVIASGIATLVMSLSTIEALEETSAAYYERYRFADVFAQVKRAPEKLTARIRKIPGVQTVQTRITRYTTVDVAGFAEPVIGLLSSVPEDRQPSLNQLVLRKGSWLSPQATDEVIINEPFAEAHGLKINDVISLILNGRKKPFRIKAIALSPEHIYSLGPGMLLPDDQRFAVMWMGRQAMSSAFDLDAAFNDLTLTVEHQASISPILDQLDALLAPYGGISAIERADQISNWFVMNEIAQQKTMATILPSIFLAVSVFLTHMILSRLIATERTEIGLLKAFGYSQLQVSWHYLKMVVVICLSGIALGSLLGLLLGRYNTQMYADLFRFPLLVYQPGIQSFLLGGLISVAGALAGAMGAVRKVVQLPPAVAMSPPAPPNYQHGFFSRKWVTQWLDQPTRIALRQIGRWPLRSFLTSAGMAFSMGLIVMTLQWNDSLSLLAQVNFFEAQKQDLMVGLAEPKKVRALHDLEHLPGVMRAEPVRHISADLYAEHRSHRGSITALAADNQLQSIYDDAERTSVAVPDEGLILAKRLAEKLQLSTGDMVRVDVLEGRRPSLLMPVVGTVETYLGMAAYANLSAINRLLMEGELFQFANLKTDPQKAADLFTALKNTPMVSSVMVKQAALDAFNETLVEHLMVFITMFIVLASMVAFGVAYNSTRIALSERGRELATLRVLGFTHGETSYVLLGEVTLLILLGLLIGTLVGWGLVWSMATAFDTELFRVPLVINEATVAWSMIIVLFAALLSFTLISGRVRRLDLIKVLKTRE
jgi:putative ABC transport system permease protein